MRSMLHILGRTENMRLKRAGILTVIVVLMLAVYASVMLVSLRVKIEDARAEQALLQQQVDEKTLANAELEYSIENSDDDDTIAEVARDRLGLVTAGERIFYGSN